MENCCCFYITETNSIICTTRPDVRIEKNFVVLLVLFFSHVIIRKQNVLSKTQCEVWKGVSFCLKGPCCLKGPYCFHIAEPNTTGKISVKFGRKLVFVFTLQTSVIQVRHRNSLSLGRGIVVIFSDFTLQNLVIQTPQRNSV